MAPLSESLKLTLTITTEQLRAIGLEDLTSSHLATFDSARTVREGAEEAAADDVTRGDDVISHG